MPNANQYIYVYGTKGGADLLGATPTMFPLTRDGRPSELAAKQEEAPHAHTTAFYDCITKGAKPPADIIIGATAALTSILGHEAMVRERVVNWSELGVDV
jgi:predicted dehydrogenase